MSDDIELTDKLIQAYGAVEEVSFELLYERGDKIAGKYGLKLLDAVYYYLIQKHHWTPAKVKAMKYGDLAFCISEE